MFPSLNIFEIRFNFESTLIIVSTPQVMQVFRVQESRVQVYDNVSGSIHNLIQMLRARSSTPSHYEDDFNPEGKAVKRCFLLRAIQMGHKRIHFMPFRPVAHDFNEVHAEGFGV